MARKDLGKRPTGPEDVIDKSALDEGLATKYTKPADGIPGEDIAEHAVGVDKIDATGVASRTKVLYGDGRWSVIVGNTILVEPDGDYLLDLPVEAFDGEMVLYEIRPPVASITVTFPSSLVMVGGLPSSLDIPPGVGGYVGIRWSAAADSWTCLAVALETF